MADEPIKLIVVLEGGNLQGVFSNNPAFFAEVEVISIDYDTDGSEVQSYVKQTNGDLEPAFMNRFSVEESALPDDFWVDASELEDDETPPEEESVDQIGKDIFGG